MRRASIAGGPRPPGVHRREAHVQTLRKPSLLASENPATSALKMGHDFWQDELSTHAVRLRHGAWFFDNSPHAELRRYHAR